jgi:hypothetical protein
MRPYLDERICLPGPYFSLTIFEYYQLLLPTPHHELQSVVYSELLSPVIRYPAPAGAVQDKVIVRS